MTTPSIEERLARLEGSYEQINLRLGRLEREAILPPSEAKSLRYEIAASRPDPNARVDRIVLLMRISLGLIAANIVATILARLL